MTPTGAVLYSTVAQKRLGYDSHVTVISGSALPELWDGADKCVQTGWRRGARQRVYITERERYHGDGGARRLFRS